MLNLPEAARILAATSCRKAVLKAAASSKLKGGTNRVLVRPGTDAFAITAIPQDDSNASPLRNGLVMCVRLSNARRGGKARGDAQPF